MTLRQIGAYIGRMHLEDAISVIQNGDGNDILLTAIIYPRLDDFPDPADHEAIEKKIREQIAKMNRKLVSYKQIRNVEFRYTEFEKTTSKKIKRHLVR
mgnify:CR=1 FL=1